MSPAYTSTPPQILSGLLADHPEAPSLLAEASHRQGLAEQSAATADRALATMRAARVRLDELRHKLDPRDCRPLHFGSGLMFIASMAAIVAVLDGVELMPVLPGKMAVSAAVAATAVWLTGAWLVALAVREKRRALLATVLGGVIAVSLILAMLHGLSSPSGWPTVWARIGVSLLSTLLIIVLTTGATVLMVRMEPASVFFARQQWQRKRSAHEAAQHLNRADAEAAAIARQSWLGLVRTHASMVAGEGGEQVVQDTLALASALQHACRISLDLP